MLALLTLGVWSTPGTVEAQLPPTGLGCTVLQQNVLLSWTNAELYDFIEIRRDAVLLLTLPGTTTAFTDPGVPASFHVYHVNGVIAAAGGQAATCQVQITPPPLEPPLEPPPSLKTLLPPVPASLFNYIKDQDAAIRLGKAFFWDMQTGSDGLTACATCHYHAGSDTRSRNILSPGPDGIFQVGTPNHRVSLEDFPFHKLNDVGDQNSLLLSDSDDAAGSQGVHFSNFIDVIPGSEEDSRTSAPDPAFNVGGLNMRRVTGRSAPTVINAVYNIENFWDGRASFWFNGRSIFGHRDVGAMVLKADLGTSIVTPTQIQIDRSALASQAVGPPLSGTEMSAHGRDFPKLGKKLLSLEPLQFQIVHPTDSVLGPLVDVDGSGLSTNYVQMIQDAFVDEWWLSDKLFDASFGELLTTGTPANTDEFTLMEANFSFFWGLAIQMYESTLVSDDSPYDQFQDGDVNALSTLEIEGLDVFTRSNCLLCHTTPVFTSAVSSKLTVVLEPEASALEGILERMPMKDAFSAVYDGGFYNIGVRPTTEDIGRGGVDLNGDPLSFAGFVQLYGLASLPFQTGTVILNPPPIPSEEIAMAGAMKTPTLRNTELTGPYFHNGSYATLEQVVQFYARGGNFADENIDTLSPIILPLPFLLTSPARQEALVAFLHTLTDERVRQEMAPFDHPQLFVSEGATGDTANVLPAFPGAPTAADRFKEIPAVGSLGRPAEGITELLEFLRPQATTALSCAENGAGGVTLNWINADLYPLIRIERDGQLIVVLSGASEAYTDPNQAPGSWDYDVFAVDGTQIGLKNLCVVEISPPAPTAVVATQLATGVALNWTNAHAYDSLDLFRDGAPITTLVAGSEVFIDAGAAPGAHQYDVVGFVEGVPSAPGTSSLTVLPSPVVGLACTTGAGTADLSWLNTGTYDSIEILRDGAFLSSLAGTAQSFQDAAPVSGVTLYEVIARTNATDAPAATCSLTFAPSAITNFTCTDSLGSAVLTWVNGDTFTQIEVRRNGLFVATLAGTEVSFIDPSLGAAGPGLHEYRLTPSTEGISGTPTICTITIVPSAVTGITCNAIGTGNLVSWTNSGAYDAVEVRSDGLLVATLAGNANFYLDPQTLSGTTSYEVTATADAVASAPASCSVTRTPFAVTNLTCLGVPGGVALGWTNNGTYDELRVLRNGALLTTLAGTATSFLDPAPPTGVVTYNVRSVGAGLESTTSPTCNISVLPQVITGLSCTLPNPCGLTVTASWTNAELYDTIEIAIDGIPANTLPGISQSTTLTLPISGTHVISFVAVKQGLPSFPTDCTVVSLDDSALSPISLTATTNPTTCTVNASWTAQGIYGSIDLQVDGVSVQTLPGTATSATFTLPGTGTQNLCVIATSECGTVLPATCTSVSCSSDFSRGDVNADGQADISDTIFLLFSLFVPGSPAVSCSDAADTNDDGLVDVTDAVRGLQTVFGQAGPLQSPYLSCGSDPTADSLDCAAAPNCP